MGRSANRSRVAVHRARAGGDCAATPRPAVIVRSDLYSATGSIVVCPLTTRKRDAPLLRVGISPSAGLPLTAPCWTMVDKLTSIRRDRPGRGSKD